MGLGLVQYALQLSVRNFRACDSETSRPTQCVFPSGYRNLVIRRLTSLGTTIKKEEGEHLPLPRGFML